MGVLFALLASCLWGTADFLGGLLARRLPVLAVLLISQAISAPLMAVIATATGSWSAPLDYLPWALAAGVSGLLALGLFYRALAIGTMGIVSPIASLGVLVPLTVGLARGQVPSGPQLVGIVLAVVGVVLASGPELSGAAGPRPVILAIGSAVGFGLVFTFIAEGSKTSVVMTATTMRLLSLVVAVVALLAVRNLGGAGRRDLLPLALIGAFDALSNAAFGLATRSDLLPVVGVLGSLYPVVTVLLAWRILRERMMAVQYAGVAVALSGVVLISAFAL